MDGLGSGLWHRSLRWVMLDLGLDGGQHPFIGFSSVSRPSRRVGTSHHQARAFEHSHTGLCCDQIP